MSQLLDLDANQVVKATATQMPDGSFAQKVNVLSGLIPGTFDEVALTYVPSGNGVGEISTATYKRATVTVATLTLSYDGSNRLVGIVRS